METCLMSLKEAFKVFLFSSLLSVQALDLTRDGWVQQESWFFSQTGNDLPFKFADKKSFWSKDTFHIRVGRF